MPRVLSELDRLVWAEYMAANERARAQYEELHEGIDARYDVVRTAARGFYEREVAALNPSEG